MSRVVPGPAQEVVLWPYSCRGPDLMGQTKETVTCTQGLGDTDLGSGSHLADQRHRVNHYQQAGYRRRMWLPVVYKLWLSGSLCFVTQINIQSSEPKAIVMVNSKNWSLALTLCFLIVMENYLLNPHWGKKVKERNRFWIGFLDS